MAAPPSLLHHALDIGVQGADVAPGTLSAAGWSRLRRSVTTAVFVLATIAAVVVGVRAVDVSPVAPPAAVGQLAPPAVAADVPAPAVISPIAPVVVPPAGRIDDGAGNGRDRRGAGANGGGGGGGGGRR